MDFWRAKVLPDLPKISGTVMSHNRLWIGQSTVRGASSHCVDICNGAGLFLCLACILSILLYRFGISHTLYTARKVSQGIPESHS